MKNWLACFGIAPFVLFVVGCAVDVESHESVGEIRNNLDDYSACFDACTMNYCGATCFDTGLLDACYRRCQQKSFNPTPAGGGTRPPLPKKMY